MTATGLGHRGARPRGGVCRRPEPAPNTRRSSACAPRSAMLLLLLPLLLLLALLGARQAAALGAPAPLKRCALSCLLLCHGAWRQRAAGGAPAEPRRPRPLRPDPHAIDSVYFTGFAETNKTFVIARLAKRPDGVCEMWLFLRVDGIGEFEHPQHPNMMVNDESEEIWSGGGLTIEYLEPQTIWKISFDGLLSWENFTEVFNFNVDSHPGTFAHAFAQEPWTIEFFHRVKKQREQHFRHEEWGQSVGEIEIENHGKTKVLLKGVRSHSYGIRNWSEIYRYVMILAHFEDGTAAHLTVINLPDTTTNLAVGYVFFPDGKKAGIEWSNASLAEMADDGVIKDEYGVSLMAGGKYFDVSATLDKQACPMVYNGLTGSGVFHECIADFQLNGITPGWGLVEFYYRDEAAQAVPNLQLGSKAKGPDLSS
ncbi:uncharacterized protein LOC133214737 isoform X2 [Neopsephotus bourkii]|uniref:uncharacterized protein LOC133214737 isoform X2 n=1 Tax=Neopsephotus bourkii TaxID=309878 RepID=UPI002AA506AD|nr:uncharacterized protein LOC133214737 isoform X2 [Neopsephotus bourkii]